MEQLVDRMTEALATKEDIRLLREDNKVLHDRLNSHNIFIPTGFTVTAAAVVLAHLLT